MRPPTVPTPEPGNPAEPSAAAAPPPPSKPSAPETHGRGVRMIIYLAGVAIMLALIGWIVFLPPDSPDKGGKAGDHPTQATQDPEAPDPLLGADGKIDPAKYQDMAAKLATEAGIAWRYGPDWHKYHKEDDFAGLPTVPQPGSKPLGATTGKVDHQYQLGNNPPQDLTSMRNIQGQVGYLPTEGQLPGVDHITAVETTTSTVDYAPRPGGALSQDGHPEVELTSGKAAFCARDKDIPIGHMVDMARGDGLDGAAHTVMVFDQGLIATAGTSGTQDGQCLKLPKNTVPTSVAVTPGNEFALITTWDTEKTQGGLAVVALTGKAQSTRADFAKAYAGLPGSGYITSMKLLGIVPLDLAAPTSIGVTTDFHGNTELDRRQEWLTSPAGRANWKAAVAHTGRAVITSVAERKAVVVDLTPLFDGVNDAFFADSVTQLPQPGGGEKAWPPAFSAEPGMAPKPGGAVTLPATPNAVALAWDGKFAYVATRDGNLRVIGVENAAQPVELAQIKVGANPTGITHTKDGGQFLVTSRGDRVVQWVQTEGNAGRVTRTLADSRLADPIAAEDLGTTQRPGEKGTPATIVPVIAVADFSGLVHTYRIGEAAFADGNKVALPQEGWEYGGGYDPKGKPFRVSVTLDRPVV
ncbi:hypothetical protein Afil01_42860 [Actinorhabdospora filicis]|uniref:Uncharacterized protein n=1 Tax=Actinorhabdospora filicis TaxID=1785913 RepID=A0A9W6SP70_9ACTN|nr:hypothetical protein [Actinorhabdospora filicis]GLZ79479.1 hypothetical protein Afil01_42860 [Actinorhabdospora filicis]